MAPAGLTHNIYLIASIDNPNIAGDSFGAIAAAINVSCLALKSSDRLRDDPAATRAIIEKIQGRNIAVLINENAETAREMGADGVHLNTAAELKAGYESARSILGDQAIIGVEIGASRHDAMVLAEQGADYVAFSGQTPATGSSSPAAMPDMIAWWSDLFETPCVAFGVSDPASAQECSRRGADFIAIDLDKLSSTGSTMETLVEICSAIDNVTAAA